MTIQQKSIYIPILQIGGLYFFWITIHYYAPYLYIYWCTPPTWIGFITSPFMATTPHCTALRWGIYHGSEVIHGMWAVFGSYIFYYWIRPLHIFYMK
jgi:hypothetical protein